ncbi:MAG: TolC family protein [Treponema sp.]|nr:TolC family protein [Treponema sp.]
MVLEKKLYIALILFLLSSLLFSQEENYWKKTISTAFENSENVSNIKRDYLSTKISKKQYDLQWFPQSQISLQGSSSTTRGDGLYILNEASDSALTQVLSPFINYSIYQRLPGQGSLSFSAGYGFNFIPTRRTFLQWPQISLSLNQYLGRGAFGLTRNPEYKLLKEQLKYSDIMYKKNLTSQIQEILSLIQSLDILCAKEDYYTSLVKEYESELKTAEQKNAAGMQSGLEEHYARFQLSEVTNSLTELQYSKKQLLIEISILIPDFDISDLHAKRDELLDMVNKLYAKVNPNSNSINNNTYNVLYNSVLQQYLYQYQNNEISYAPSLVISSSLSPDGNYYGYYSDWYKSFRLLKETPYPIKFSVSIGIQKSFELPGARKLRKEIYKLSRESVEDELYLIQKTQEKELAILQEQIKSDLSYIVNLEKDIYTEQTFREKRKKLFNDNIITEDEFTQSETVYFKIYKDYITSFWNVITNQIQIIDLCADDFPLLEDFIGEHYVY